MPKVNLEDVRLAVTAISKTIVATIPNKDNLTMRHKHDVTSDFLRCIVDYGANTKFNIAGGDKDEEEYQVAIVKRNGFKNALFTRKEVLKLLGNMIKDGVGEKVNVEQWAEVNLK